MRNDLPVRELEEIASVNIGEALRLTRVHYGKSLSDVEKSLRIRASQIDAIEQGDTVRLPGRVYAIGFVRSYAEYLGIDGDKVVQLFKAQYMDGPDAAMLSLPVQASDSKVPTFWIVTVCLLVAAAGVYATKYKVQIDRTLVTEIASVPDDIRADVVYDLLAEYGEPSSAGDMHEFSFAASLPYEISVLQVVEGDEMDGIILNVLDNSWVEVKDASGAIILSDILEKGHYYRVQKEQEGLSMSLGNVANVEISIDGRVLKPLGSEGDVRHGIPLNTEYLNKLAFQDIDSDSHHLSPDNAGATSAE